MKNRRKRLFQSACGSNRGFTLIELTAAVALAMGVAGASLTIINQHIAFSKILKSFDFIRDEAPQINRALASLMSSANDYRIYTDKDAAFSNGNQLNVGGTIVLSYRNPSGFDDRAAIIFETLGGKKQLNYYRYLNGWAAVPNWTITSLPENIAFSDTSGVLTISMIGKNGEKITYVGSTR